MKHPIKVRLIIVLALLAAVVIVGGIGWYKFHRTAAPASSMTSSSTSTITCMQSDEYFIVNNNPNTPGLDLIAKHKTSPDETLPCTATVGSTDVVVQNDLPEDVLGLVGHFLIIDSGTAPPPRGLVIYDLNTQTSTLTDTYSPPLTIASTSITYWESISEKATPENCPNLGQYTGDGLGAVIESDVTLSFPALTKKVLGEYRCSPTQ